MLTISLSCGPNDVNYSHCDWRVGEPYPLSAYDMPCVTEVTADGDELAVIIRGSHNVPIALNAHVQTWYGDTAKFIVANIVRAASRKPIIVERKED